jgi:hypothetical protein
MTVSVSASARNWVSVYRRGRPTRLDADFTVRCVTETIHLPWRQRLGTVLAKECPSKFVHNARLVTNTKQVSMHKAVSDSGFTTTFSGRKARAIGLVRENRYPTCSETK